MKERALKACWWAAVFISDSRRAFCTLHSALVSITPAFGVINLMFVIAVLSLFIPVLRTDVIFKMRVMYAI